MPAADLSHPKSSISSPPSASLSNIPDFQDRRRIFSEGKSKRLKDEGTDDKTAKQRGSSEITNVNLGRSNKTGGSVKDLLQKFEKIVSGKKEKRKSRRKKDPKRSNTVIGVDHPAAMTEILNGKTRKVRRNSISFADIEEEPMPSVKTLLQRFESFSSLEYKPPAPKITHHDHNELYNGFAKEPDVSNKSEVRTDASIDTYKSEKIGERGGNHDESIQSVKQPNSYERNSVKSLLEKFEFSNNIENGNSSDKNELVDCKKYISKTPEITHNSEIELKIAVSVEDISSPNENDHLVNGSLVKNLKSKFEESMISTSISENNEFSTVEENGTNQIQMSISERIEMAKSSVATSSTPIKAEVSKCIEDSSVDLSEIQMTYARSEETGSTQLENITPQKVNCEDLARRRSSVRDLKKRFEECSSQTGTPNKISITPENPKTPVSQLRNFFSTDVESAEINSYTISTISLDSSGSDSGDDCHTKNIRVSKEKFPSHYSPSRTNENNVSLSDEPTPNKLEADRTIEKSLFDSSSETTLKETENVSVSKYTEMYENSTLSNKFYQDTDTTCVEDSKLNVTKNETPNILVNGFHINQKNTSDHNSSTSLNSPISYDHAKEEKVNNLVEILTNKLSNSSTPINDTEESSQSDEYSKNNRAESPTLSIKQNKDKSGQSRPLTEDEKLFFTTQDMNHVFDKRRKTSLSERPKPLKNNSLEKVKEESGFPQRSASLRLPKNCRQLHEDEKKLFFGGNFSSTFFKGKSVQRSSSDVSHLSSLNKISRKTDFRHRGRRSPEISSDHISSSSTNEALDSSNDSLQSVMRDGSFDNSLDLACDSSITNYIDDYELLEKDLIGDISLSTDAMSSESISSAPVEKSLLEEVQASDTFLEECGYVTVPLQNNDPEWKLFDLLLHENMNMNDQVLHNEENHSPANHSFSSVNEPLISSSLAGDTHAAFEIPQNLNNGFLKDQNVDEAVRDNCPKKVDNAHTESLAQATDVKFNDLLLEPRPTSPSCIQPEPSLNTEPDCEFSTSDDKDSEFNIENVKIDDPSNYFTAVKSLDQSIDGIVTEENIENSVANNAKIAQDFHPCGDVVASTPNYSAKQSDFVVQSTVAMSSESIYSASVEKTLLEQVNAPDYFLEECEEVIIPLKVNYPKCEPNDLLHNKKKKNDRVQHNGEKHSSTINSFSSVNEPLISSSLARDFNSAFETPQNLNSEFLKEPSTEEEVRDICNKEIDSVCTETFTQVTDVALKIPLHEQRPTSSCTQLQSSLDLSQDDLITEPDREFSVSDEKNSDSSNENLKSEGSSLYSTAKNSLEQAGDRAVTKEDSEKSVDNLAEMVQDLQPCGDVDAGATPNHSSKENESVVRNSVQRRSPTHHETLPESRGGSIGSGPVQTRKENVPNNYFFSSDIDWGVEYVRILSVVFWLFLIIYFFFS